MGMANITAQQNQMNQVVQQEKIQARELGRWVWEK